MRRVFPNLFGQSRSLSSTPTASPTPQQNVLSSTQSTPQGQSSRSVTNIEELIGRVQRNVPGHSSNPMRNRVPSSTPYRVTYRRNSSQRKSVPSGRDFAKDIVMVDSDDVNVPRGARRCRLHECGLVINFAQFNTLWKEEVVMETVENAFADVLDKSQPQPR